MSLQEEALLRGWLNSNFQKPTPKEFCSDAIGVGSREEGTREGQFTIMAHEVFFLKQAGLGREEIAERTAIHPLIVQYIMGRSSAKVAATSLYRWELDGDQGSLPLHKVEPFFNLQIDDCHLGDHLRKFFYQGALLILDKKEWAILTKLLSTLNRYCGMVELMAAFYAGGFYKGKPMPAVGTAYLRKHIKILHTTLARVGLGIYAVRGKGFRLGTLK